MFGCFKSAAEDLLWRLCRCIAFQELQELHLPFGLGLGIEGLSNIGALMLRMFFFFFFFGGGGCCSINVWGPEGNIISEYYDPYSMQVQSLAEAIEELFEPGVAVEVGV